ncbi:EamA family transporter [Phenylobacterium sp. LjRoot219]|uniref:EamA family transporter n=1 Tax=Phenylobacterium sp. LjRoot219 TaxID=3342283 RepID=UPI003ECFF47D
MNRDALPPLHLLLAIAIVAVWGVNFVVIKAALEALPPLTLAALRFTVALIPAVFFLKRPDVPWRNLAAYGLLIGVGQFGLIFIALRGHISPGLASLVAQMQVFFTIGMAVMISGERLRAHHLAALLLAAAGLGWLMLHANGDVTPLGLILTLLSAAAWAGGNVVTRATPKANMLAYVVWASLFSVPPLFLLAFAFEGWTAVTQSIVHASPATWAAVAWQAYGNTLFGYGMWAWLLARHPAATISPLSLLVPVFGMGASAVLLAEPLQPWKLTAAALVLGGLVVNMVGPRLAQRRRAALTV